MALIQVSFDDKETELLAKIAKEQTGLKPTPFVKMKIIKLMNDYKEKHE